MRDRPTRTPPPGDAEALGRTLLPSGGDLARDLVRKRPLRVCADVGLCYAGFIAGFALLAVFTANTWWAAALAFLIIGNRQYALSILSHEGGHRKLFRSRRVNDWFTEIVLCAPVGIDFRREQSGHSTHHRQLALPSDPDRYLYSARDKSTRPRFAFFLTGLSMFPHALEQALRGRGEVATEPFSLRAFLARRLSTIAVQAVIFTAISAFFPWWYYLAFWLAPMYPWLFIPHQIRRFCEHAQPVLPDEDADADRLVSFDPSPIERLFIAPYNINYHAEHHLWPFVPYYNMPRLRPLVSGTSGIEIRSSYASFLLRFARSLPLRRRASRAAAERRRVEPVGRPAPTEANVSG